MSRSHLAARVGTTAVASLVIVLVAMHLIQPGLDPVDHLVSEYVHGRLGWLVTSSYVLGGTGTILMAWPLVARLGGRGRVLASAICLTVVGSGLIGTGLTRIDVGASDVAMASTTSGQLHELASYAAVIGLVAGSFVIPATFDRDPLLSAGASALRRFRWGILAGLLGVLLARPLGTVGLAQRVFLAVALSWLTLVGVQLSSIESEETRAVLRRMGHRGERRRLER